MAIDFPVGFMHHPNGRYLLLAFLLQIAEWGADGVIVGSAMVKLLGEAKSPQEGLKELENLTKSLKSALP